MAKSQVADESELQSMSAQLTQSNVVHKLWTEQPENVATCLACQPMPKAVIHSLLRHLKLFA
jgi:peptidyl-tRNA hydrolase